MEAKSFQLKVDKAVSRLCEGPGPSSDSKVGSLDDDNDSKISATVSGASKGKGKELNEISATGSAVGSAMSYAAVVAGQRFGSEGTNHALPSHIQVSQESSVKIQFGNPSVEQISGIVHLYRVDRETSDECCHEDDGAGVFPPNKLELPRSKFPVVAMIGVPNFVTIRDICLLMEPDYLPAVKYLRVVTEASSAPSTQATQSDYMVLIHFRDERIACDFVDHVDGTLYSSFTPECKVHLGFVSGIVWNMSGSGYQDEVIHPQGLPEGAFLADLCRAANHVDEGTNKQTGAAAGALAGGAGTRTSTSSSSQGIRSCIEGNPIDSLSSGSEIPSCAVCLERLDSTISGIATTVCNHSFHCDCVRRYEDPACPVCRHTCSEPSDSKCVVCGADSDLWICLLCGSVGCGRYEGGHAHEHFAQSGHAYSMQLGTQSVWDYCGDRWIHRVVQSKYDGKILESTSEVETESDAILAAKLESKTDALTVEMAQLLAAQLDEQRRLYEAQIEEIFSLHASEKRQLRSEQEEMQGDLSAYKAKAEELQKCVEDAKEACALNEKRARDLEKRLKAARQQVENEKDENETLRELNLQLVRNQAELKSMISKSKEEHAVIIRSKDAQIAELNENIRDLLLHFEAQTKVAESSDARGDRNLSGGSVSLGGKRREQ